MKKCDKYLQVPFDIVLACPGKPFDACLWAYVFGWENSTKRSAVKLTHEHIADFFGVSVSLVKDSITRLKMQKLLGTKRTPNGLVYTTRIDRIKQFNKIGNLPRIEDGDCTVPKPKVKPQNAAKVIAESRLPIGEKQLSVIDEKGLSDIRNSAMHNLDLSFRSIKQEEKEKNITKKEKEEPASQPEPEPFEAGPDQGRSLPSVVNGRIAAAYGSSPGPETRKRVAMPPDHAGVMLAADELRIAVKVFDTQAVKVGRYFTDDQRDAPQFIRKVLVKLALLRESGMTVTLNTLAKTVEELWDDGLYVQAWQTVQDVKAQAELEMRQAEEERLRANSDYKF